MKRIARLAITGLFVFVLVACAEPTPEYVEGMINPGDEIDSMVFTTDDEMDINRIINAFCGWEPKEQTDEVIDNITYHTAYFECGASPGDRIFFGNCVGLVKGFNTEDLDADWKKQKTEITFDDQGVNFSLFGSLDFIDPNGKDVRNWNVMVENITPGTHTVQCRRDLNERIVEVTYDITVPSETETYPILSAEVVPGQHPFTSEKAKLNYFLYIPDGYGVEAQEKWPLILFLHGLEEGAMNSMDVLENIMLKPPENLDDFPFIIVSPQGTKEYAEYEIWSPDEIVSSVMALLDEVQSKVAVDTSRIYLTGDSAGGNGTWVIGLRHPDRFAALVSIMGYYGYPFTVPENICDLVDTPVWAFHGAEDELVELEAEQILVDALEACGGDVQFTVYPGIYHDVGHNQVYTEELFAWLLSKTLE
ncbi:prolyl oligopeptidase family serine peptidase [Chloroflexota bacterium]